MIDTKHEFVSQLPSQVAGILCNQALPQAQKLTAKRGRPRDPERFQRIIDTATIQFITLGYERTSLTAISKLSGISKMTIYSYFASKQKLFETCVRHKTETSFEFLFTKQLDVHNPSAVLRLLGQQFMVLIRDPMVISTYRMIGAMAMSNETEIREACNIFYEQGPLRLQTQVVQYLELATQTGTLNIDNTDDAADFFLSLFHNIEYFKSFFGLDTLTAIDTASMQAKLERDTQVISRNVHAFMLMYGNV